MSWRLDDWVNPHNLVKAYYPNPNRLILPNGEAIEGSYANAVGLESYEAGASAMLSALLVYLDEPCDKHGTRHHDGRYATSRHKDCPQCMNELRGEE